MENLIDNESNNRKPSHESKDSIYNEKYNPPDLTNIELSEKKNLYSKEDNENKDNDLDNESNEDELNENNENKENELNEDNENNEDMKNEDDELSYNQSRSNKEDKDIKIKSKTHSNIPLLVNEKDNNKYSLPNNQLSNQDNQNYKMNKKTSEINNTEIDRYFKTNISQLLVKDAIIGFANCITAQKGTHLSALTAFYRCSNHENPEFYVCESCALECHNLDIYDDTLKKVSRKGNFICMCAENHHTKCSGYKKEVTERVTDNCDCNNYFKDFCQYYFTYDLTPPIIENDLYEYDDIYKNWQELKYLNDKKSEIINNKAKEGIIITMDDLKDITLSKEEFEERKPKGYSEYKEKIIINGENIKIRKCLFCFLSNLSECCFANENDDIDEVTPSSMKIIEENVKVIHKSELSHIPDEQLCQCKAMHHFFGSEFSKIGTVNLFFSVIELLKKEPDLLEPYNISLKKIVSFLYDYKASPIFKTVLDDYFTSQMNDEKDSSYQITEVEFSILKFSQIFSDLIENYQMSNRENPFQGILTVSEMITIFQPQKQKYTEKEMYLKSNSMAVFYNLCILPITFITSRSVLKNDMNFTPFHRNYFLSDLSILLNELEGEDKFFELLDKIAEFLNTEIKEFSEYEDEEVSMIFIPLIFYFVQILKTFQYYKIKKVTTLKKIQEYIKVLIFVFQELNLNGIFKDYEIEESSNNKNEKIVINKEDDEIDIGEKTKKDNNDKRGIDTTKKRKIIILKQSETNNIISNINNQTYEKRTENIINALENFEKKNIDYTKYILKTLKEYDLENAEGNWILDEISNISKMLLIKYNDIAFEKLLNTKNLDDKANQNISFCFMKNSFTEELISTLYSPSNSKVRIEDIDIIDMLIHDDDCYIINLNYVSKSKFNLYFELQHLKALEGFKDIELTGHIIVLKNSLNSYLFNQIDLEEFEKQLEDVLLKLKIHLSNIFQVEENNKISKINHGYRKSSVEKQIKLAEEGIFFDLLEILMTLIRLETINMKYMTHMFSCIELFAIDNPFLCAIIFSEEVYKTILTVKNVEIYKAGLHFYFKCSYVLFYYNYKIDLTNFFLTFHMNLIETDNLILEFKINNIMNLLLKQILKIRLPKDYSNPMGRVLHIVNKFRKKINLCELMKELFMEDSVPCIFVGPLDGKIKSYYYLIFIFN